ncbi:hypothetical protein EDS67_22810 [candidate division KSB1 bacterium]|nr:MAG: hypothetical protein EDS67_22810 [candidate division KSB1 bacterium]MBC6951799.1 hypothetical protein [candidate division KSB1 bacterium]MCE7945120.1 hypothetical protein [Chlorobi bacterium CHB1]
MAHGKECRENYLSVCSAAVLKGRGLRKPIHSTKNCYNVAVLIVAGFNLKDAEGGEIKMGWKYCSYSRLLMGRFWM